MSMNRTVLFHDDHELTDVAHWYNYCHPRSSYFAGNAAVFCGGNENVVKLPSTSGELVFSGRTAPHRVSGFADYLSSGPAGLTPKYWPRTLGGNCDKSWAYCIQTVNKNLSEIRRLAETHPGAGDREDFIRIFGGHQDIRIPYRTHPRLGLMVHTAHLIVWTMEDDEWRA